MKQLNIRLRDEEWRWRVFLAGRRWGKNVAARAAIEEMVTVHGVKSILMVGQTFNDFARLIAPAFASLPSAPRITGGGAPLVYWPDRDARAWFVSAEKPTGWYGLGAEVIWMDEAAQYPMRMGVSAWDEVDTIASEGAARVIVTCSPYEHGPSLHRLRALVERADALVTRGSTLENRRLSAEYLASRAERKGSRYYQSMVLGEILDDVAGSLWSRAAIRRARLNVTREVRARLLAACDRIVVAVDPTTTVSETSHNCGIAVVGRLPRHTDPVCLVFESVGVKELPPDWGRRVGAMYDHYDAHEVIAEENQGGKMVEAMMANAPRGVRYRGIRTTRGKAERASPVADLYNVPLARYLRRTEHLPPDLRPPPDDDELFTRVWHVAATDEDDPHALLESEQLAFTDPPAKSDDVTDALVFAVTDLLIQPPPGRIWFRGV